MARAVVSIPGQEHIVPAPDFTHRKLLPQVVTPGKPGPAKPRGPSEDGAEAQDGVALPRYGAPSAMGDPVDSCSFCGKSADEVRKLIHGTAWGDAYICDECVDQCNDIIFGGAPSIVIPPRTPNGAARRMVADHRSTSPGRRRPGELA
jgi:hypothetical protein